MEAEGDGAGQTPYAVPALPGSLIQPQFHPLFMRQNGHTVPNGVVACGNHRSSEFL